MSYYRRVPRRYDKAAPRRAAFLSDFGNFILTRFPAAVNKNLYL
nr:MAG TPA: hypothetical protein [Caudoviricetes sp.]